MSKYETTVRLNQIQKLVEERKYKKAAAVLETLDVRQIKTRQDLQTFAEIYVKTEQFEAAKAIYLRLYKKNRSKKTLYRLVYLAIRTNHLDEAEDFYQEFLHLNHSEQESLILRYRIDKAKGVPFNKLIDTLERLKEEDYIEEWAYELAKLYQRAGRKEECARECEDIKLWFGEGEIVERAQCLLEYLSNEQELYYEDRDYTVAQPEEPNPEDTGSLPDLEEMIQEQKEQEKKTQEQESLEQKVQEPGEAVLRSKGGFGMFRGFWKRGDKEPKETIAQQSQETQETEEKPLEPQEQRELESREEKVSKKESRRERREKEKEKKEGKKREIQTEEVSQQEGTRVNTPGVSTPGENTEKGDASKESFPKESFPKVDSSPVGSALSESREGEGSSVPVEKKQQWKPERPSQSGMGITQDLAKEITAIFEAERRDQLREKAVAVVDDAAGRMGDVPNLASDVLGRMTHAVQSKVGKQYIPMDVSTELSQDTFGGEVMPQNASVDAAGVAGSLEPDRVGGDAFEDGTESTERVQRPAGMEEIVASGVLPVNEEEVTMIELDQIMPEPDIPELKQVMPQDSPELGNLPELEENELPTTRALHHSLDDLLTLIGGELEPKHFVLMGQEEEKILGITKKIVQVNHKKGFLSTKQIARIHSQQLNDMDLLRVCSQIKGSCLLIDEASGLSFPTITKIFTVMDAFRGDFTVVLADDGNTLDELFRVAPALARRFEYVIDISQYSEEDYQ